MTDIVKLEKAEKTLRSLGYVHVLWHIDDVRTCAEENNIGDLTDAECLEIPDNILRNHDASIGVNWVTLACYAEKYVANRDS